MKNKKILFLFVFLLTIFAFVNNSFAFTEDFEGEGVTNTFFVKDEVYNKFIELEEYKSGNYNYLLVGSNGSYHIYFFSKTDDVKIWMLRTPYKSSFASNIKNYSVSWYKIQDNGTGLSKQTSTKLDEFYNSCYFEGNKYWMLTNVNIYSDNSCTDFFFEAPVTEQTVLFPILEKVEMKEPIMITIVGLAKLLIPLLICLIGFWKAWQLLSKTLYKG